MTMKAVGTAAMEMVQEVEIQFDEVRHVQNLSLWDPVSVLCCVDRSCRSKIIR